MPIACLKHLIVYILHSLIRLIIFKEACVFADITHTSITHYTFNFNVIRVYFTFYPC